MFHVAGTITDGTRSKAVRPERNQSAPDWRVVSRVVCQAGPQGAAVRRFDVDRIWGLNLHVSERDGDILHLNPGMYQDFEERRRWIWRTVHDRPAPAHAIAQARATRHHRPG